MRPRSSRASSIIPLCEPACRPLKSPVAWFFPGTPVARRSAEASVARRFLKFVSALWRPRLPGVPSIRRSVRNFGRPSLLPARLRLFLDRGCPLPLNAVSVRLVSGCPVPLLPVSAAPETPVARRFLNLVRSPETLVAQSFLVSVPLFLNLRLPFNP